MIWYMVSSMLWALGGLVVGFLLGRSGQLTDTRTDVAEFVDMPPGTEAVTITATKHRFRDSLSFDRIVGWVVIVLAVGSVTTMSYTLNRQQQAVTCQADYNAAFVAALKERSTAASADRQAQRELLTGIATARTPQESQAQMDAYLRKLDEADDQRDDNPLPQRPTC